MKPEREDVKKFSGKCKQECGEIMIEAALIFPTTLMIIMLLISTGFMFYQKAMIQSVATEIAEDIAAGYKYTDKDVWESEILPSDIRSIKKYRTSFLLPTMRSKCQDKAKKYISGRVSGASLGTADENVRVKEIKLKTDNVGRMHIEVTVSMKSHVILESALKGLGIINDTPEFTGTAYADCMDITAYAGHVRFLEYAGEKLEEDGGVIGNIMDSIAATVTHVKNSVNSVNGTIDSFIQQD